MSKHILKDLSELTAAGIITEETSGKIRVYYDQKKQQSPNHLVIIFGILGALLTGLGIILIIAHNWDDLSKGAKLFYSLLPLLLGQLICAYTLIKKADSRLWREAGSVFLLFAISASISMVSQVYNIPGSLSGFLFIWMLLSIPLIYIMQSAMTSLLVICGITWYATSLSYFDYPTEIAWFYWLMLGAVIPFFLGLMKNQRGNFYHFHRWSLGSTILLLTFTFEWIWTDIGGVHFVVDEAFLISSAVSLLACVFLIYEIRKKKSLTAINPNAYIFLIFMLLFMVGRIQPQVAQWLTNVLVLGVALATTWRGAERDNLLLLNYGLLIMAVLILCRFFDTDLSFVVRGILFMVVGLSFFGANYWLLKKRKLQNV
jgi:uncharacterized membrane protein